MHLKVVSLITHTSGIIRLFELPAQICDDSSQASRLVSETRTDQVGLKAHQLLDNVLQPPPEGKAFSDVPVDVTAYVILAFLQTPTLRCRSCAFSEGSDLPNHPDPS